MATKKNQVTTKARPARREPRRPAGRRALRAQGRQRGLALMELMLLTVPMCVLSIVLASAISATATARNKSMWKASLKAQQATREPCNGLPLYYEPTLSQKQGQFSQGRSQAAEIGLIGLPITLTNNKTEKVTEQVADFHFTSAADKMFPGRAKQAENSATFTCNEPNNGNSRRSKYEFLLIGRAVLEARKLF